MLRINTQAFTAFSWWVLNCVKTVWGANGALPSRESSKSSLVSHISGCVAEQHQPPAEPFTATQRSRGRTPPSGWASRKQFEPSRELSFPDTLVFRSIVCQSLITSRASSSFFQFKSPPLYWFNNTNQWQSKHSSMWRPPLRPSCRVRGDSDLVGVANWVGGSDRWRGNKWCI